MVFMAEGREEIFHGKLDCPKVQTVKRLERFLGLDKK